MKYGIQGYRGQVLIESLSLFFALCGLAGIEFVGEQEKVTPLYPCIPVSKTGMVK